MNAPQETKFWRRYEKGVEYLDIKNLVNRANKCWNFYIGKQWEGIEAKKLINIPTVVFSVFKY